MRTAQRAKGGFLSLHSNTGAEDPGETEMQRGWRAYKDVKRPRSKDRTNQAGRISKKRRTAHKNQEMALRQKGLLK